MSEEVKEKKPGKFLGFVKKNIVAVIAFFAAVITSCIVPPDMEYIRYKDGGTFGYFDLKTLTCLFCVLAVPVPIYPARSMA